MMKVQIRNNSKHSLPSYHSADAAAFDLAANLAAPVTLGPLERATVPTGLYIAVPSGYEAQIRPRSGLAAHHGITIVNAPGTIDPDYRGEWLVILINLSNEPYTISDGDRIAQVIIAKCERVQWQEVEALDQTERGDRGMGGTGK